MMGWPWHQLDHLQIICTSLQTDNHASTSSLLYMHTNIKNTHTHTHTPRESTQFKCYMSHSTQNGSLRQRRSSQPISRLVLKTKPNTTKLVSCGTDGRLLLSGFQSLVTLTLTLDRVIRHTVVHQSSTYIYKPSFTEIR